MKKKFAIAIDGPAGSGKSTIARYLSEKLNILYLDTGAMYRAVALKTLSLDYDVLDEEKIKTFINDINLKIEYENGKQKTILDDIDVSEKIREPHVSMSASKVSSLKCVRIKMVEMQRKIANNISCVLDGRDIGSFVLPNADYKFYLTATVKERAKRRYLEMKEKGFDVNIKDLEKEIEQRDFNDKNREFSPLVQAKDAIYLDTSKMSIDEVIEKVCSYIK